MSKHSLSYLDLYPQASTGSLLLSGLSFLFWASVTLAGLYGLTVLAFSLEAL